MPELLPIYSAKIRSQVRVARKDGRLTETFIVHRIAKGIATVKPEQGNEESQSIPLGELVVVKRFGEAIFPVLRQVESVLRGKDAPHHTPLKRTTTMRFSFSNGSMPGKPIASISIRLTTPEPRTGNMNNDYVDKSDSWKHKRLSFMKKRLRIARRLLKPGTGVLIVTIEEHEVNHLGLLLEAELPDYYRQMVTIVINPKGGGGGGEKKKKKKFRFSSEYRGWEVMMIYFPFSQQNVSRKPRWERFT